MLPVLGGEVVERQQCVAILDQAVDRLVVLDAPAFDEGVERREGILLGLGHPDLLQRPLGFRLRALRQLVEDVGSLVDPTTLAARLRPQFFDRLPKAERAVGDRELGCHRKPTPLQIKEELLPGLCTLGGRSAEGPGRIKPNVDYYNESRRCVSLEGGPTLPASSRGFDLNGEASSVNKKHSSATIVADVKRFCHQIKRTRFSANITTMWSTHSRRIDSISLSANAFCHGEPGAIGLSRMPMARKRRVTAAP